MFYVEPAVGCAHVHAYMNNKQKYILLEVSNLFLKRTLCARFVYFCGKRESRLNKILLCSERLSYPNHFFQFYWHKLLTLFGING